MPGVFCIGGCARGGDLGGYEGGSSGDISEEGPSDDFKDAADECGGGLSFTGTTKVATAQGEQAIGTLKVGEKVWAYNPQTKKMELEPIQKVWRNHDNDLVDVTLVATVKDAHGKTTQKQEVIHTNEKHPFLTKEKGFIPVSQLKPGMHVLEAGGSYGMVTKLVVVSGAEWMYNLTVAQDHTYAVGLDRWIVHNCGTSGTPDPAKQVPGQANLYEGQQVDTNELSNRGWKMTRQDVRYFVSNDFRQFLQSQGKSPADWSYYMETWEKGQASIENHYWSNMWDNTIGDFHHH